MGEMGIGEMRLIWCLPVPGTKTTVDKNLIPTSIQSRNHAEMTAAETISRIIDLREFQPTVQLNPCVIKSPLSCSDHVTRIGSHNYRTVLDLHPATATDHLDRVCLRISLTELNR